MGRRRRRAPGPPGLLLIDKPAGTTSAAATRAVGRRFGLDPVGHTGTLDPAATGLLVVCTGYGTRLVPWLQEGEKSYVASIRFGAETTTCDAEGEVTCTAPVPVDLADALSAALGGFTGVITQIPPAYSAIRVDGRRAHALAREGAIDPSEIPPREVTIHSLDLLEVGADTASVSVICSPGTYIRTLAVDLGRALGTAAHLGALRRVRTGGFDVAGAIPLEALLEMETPGDHWRPVPDALPAWPRCVVEGDGLVRVLNGGDVPYEGDPDGGPVFLLDPDGRVLAVGEVEEGAEGRRLMVRRMLIELITES